MLIFMKNNNFTKKTYKLYTWLPTIGVSLLKFVVTLVRSRYLYQTLILLVHSTKHS